MQYAVFTVAPAFSPLSALPVVFSPRSALLIKYTDSSMHFDVCSQPVFSVVSSSRDITSKISYNKVVNGSLYVITGKELATTNRAK